MHRVGSSLNKMDGQQNIKFVNRLTLKCAKSLRKYKDRSFWFCGHNIWTEDVFVAQLPSNGRISV